jgi:hypothetical protein
MFAIDDPMPTISAPMRIGRPMVNFIGFSFVIAGFHERILARFQQFAVENGYGTWFPHPVEIFVEISPLYVVRGSLVVIGA